MSGSQRFMRPGGLHPIKVGDKVNNNYEIKAIHSDVWDSFLRFPAIPEDGGFLTYLAKDSSSKYVCLQILGATTSTNQAIQNELELLDRLLADGDDVGRNFIHAPVDKFPIEGPNGKHQCLVYDLYGLDLAHAEWPINMVKKLAKDSLQAVDYIHSKGICHANLYPSSLVVYPNVDPCDEARVLDLFGLSGSEEPYDKAVLALNETGTAKDEQPNIAPLRIKLTDFRKAFYLDKQPTDTKSLILANECPPPELAFDKPIDAAIDIWYLATRIGKIASGHIYYGNFLCQDNGSLSERLLFAQAVLGKEMSSDLQASLDPAAKKPQSAPESFQQYLRNAPDHDINDDKRISDDDYQNLEELLRRMLAWEAKDRISAREALGMQFLQ